MSHQLFLWITASSLIPFTLLGKYGIKSSVSFKTEVELKFRDWLENIKVESHPEWVVHWHKDPFLVLPIYLEISAVGACNHRCTFCAPEMLGYKTNYLDAAILAERFAEMKSLRESNPDKIGIRNFHFAGEGEPLLHPNLGRIFQSARKAEIDIGMFTNGIALTEHKAYQILPFLNLYLQFSVNAGTPQSYSAIHQTNPKDWTRLWENIKRAVRIKREIRSSCLIGIQLTALIQEVVKNGVKIPPNWGEIELLIRQARDAGVDYVTIKPYSQHPYSQETMKLYGDTAYVPMIDEIVTTGERLRQQYETDSFEVVFRFNRFKEYDEGKNYKFCLATPTLWGYIQSDGVLISCSAHWTNPLFHLGNINRQTFKEIWFGETRRKHIKFMKNFDISVCRKGCQPDKDNRFLDQYQKLSFFRS